MNIGEVAKQSGVSTKTIRYYESIGVFPTPPRSSNGYRTYEPQAIDKLKFIRDAQSTGLSLTEIRSILELREQGIASCEHVIHLLGHHLSELDRRISALEATRGYLVALVDRANHLDPAACTDANRCQTIMPDVAPLPGAAEIHGMH